MRSLLDVVANDLAGEVAGARLIGHEAPHGARSATKPGVPTRRHLALVFVDESAGCGAENHRATSESRAREQAMRDRAGPRHDGRGGAPANIRGEDSHVRR
jgi:hypothetical protein